jgi:hypothetical protein
MKTYIDFIMGTILLLSVSSCTNSQHRAAELAKSHLEQSVDNPKQLKIISISDPDSVFGTTYFTGQEQKNIMIIMGQVTKSIMKRTNNFENFNTDDAYVIDLAGRQMRANSEIRELLLNQTNNREWTGWKVKVDFQAVNHTGLEYKAERWYFINKDVSQVIKTLELPLP